MRRIWGTAAAACLVLQGCCFSYESDVKKLCDVRGTCSSAFETEGISRSDRDQRVADCLGSKLFTSQGRELFAALSGLQSPQEKSQKLLAEAKGVGVTKCAWAQELLGDLHLPNAPAGCAPVPDGEAGLEVHISLDTVSDSAGGMPILMLPARKALENGFGEQYRDKKDPLVIAPLRERLLSTKEMVKRVQMAKGQSAVRGLVFLHQDLHPMPQRMQRELVQTFDAVGIDDVQQVFLNTDNKLCTMPLRKK